MRAAIPQAAPAWLKDFITKARTENDVLLRAGAKQQARTRELLLNELILAVDLWLTEPIDVHEAARLSDTSEETIRRKIRRGTLHAVKDGRDYQLRRKDIPIRIERSTKSGYDLVTDSKKLARKRA